MLPTPKSLPILTMTLLIGGMAIFILERVFPDPAKKVFMAVGTAVFFAGMIAALVGTIRAIGTLNNVALRQSRGITTPIITILIAAFAWSGALLTVYKFKKSSDVRTQADANMVAETARDGR